MKQRMQESYEKGVANRRPRVLRCTSRGVRRSVNRGTGGLGIELEKCNQDADAFVNSGRQHGRDDFASSCWSCVVVNPRHAWKLHARGQIPGIRPLVATAIVAIGNGAAFRKGREFAAWMGLVPKQYSTGGKANLLTGSASGATTTCARS